MVDQLRENFLLTKTKIDNAARTTCRDQFAVRLIAVSKGQDFSKIKTLYDLGQRDFGESYAQEFSEKRNKANALNLDIVWHFIGALQSNKLKIIREADFIHSVDSVKHAEQLQKFALKPLNIFLQVNFATRSSTRQGMSVDEILHVVPSIRRFHNLKLCGLMTILPIDSDYPANYWFSQMQTLRNTIMCQGSEKIALSMGMSGDFEEAIAYGADFIRLGTQIFGRRAK